MNSSELFKKDKIVINFSILNCKEGDTYRIELIKNDSENLKAFITEKKENNIKNGNIQFSKTFSCEFEFSKNQNFNLNLKSWGPSKFMNIAKTKKYYISLSSIVSSKNSVFKIKSK